VSSTLISKFGIKTSVYTNFILKMFRIEKIRRRGRKGKKEEREEGGRGEKKFANSIIQN